MRLEALDMAEWISAKEKLPQFNTPVLTITDASGKRITTIAKMSCGAWQYQIDALGEYTIAPCFVVKYWIPIPDHPTEKM